MPWWQFTYAMHTTSAAHKQFYYSARSYASAEYWIHFRSCIVITIFIDFCQLNLTKFEHNTTVCRDESLWNRILKIFCKGSFFQKTQKNQFFFNVLRLQAAITPQWLLIDGNSLPIDPSMGFLVSIFAAGINYSKSFSWPSRSVQETFPKFLRRQSPLDGIRHTTLMQAVTIDYWVTW